MTERLYYMDAYLTEFEARVVEIAADGRRLYLDRSAFYPTSGGQPHDTGTLGESRVTDVVDEQDRIAHVLDGAARLAAGDPVKGRVDWPRRIDHMQQHTGQHLLSAVLEDLFGYHTVSVHFGDESSTLDIDAESLSRDRLRRAEERANALVMEHRPVTVAFEDAASVTGLRKPSDRTGPLRIVTIEGVDRSACGGTHVRSTSEIGALIIRGTERVRKTTRVEFICGARARAGARADREALSAIAQTLSASIGEAPALVSAQVQQLRDAESKRKRAEIELNGYRARELYDASAANEAGLRIAIVQRDDAPMDELRSLAQAFAALPRALFIGSSRSAALVMVSASGDAGMDAGAMLKAALTAAGGKGGGSPKLAQGTLPKAESIDDVLQALRAQL
ncbi:MAG: DHHA1 domain-containing protein [Gemmatimonadota bacterium]|nr:DHHA1 domain-containing protein [Gemmatimonadota bacterium]